MQRLKRSWMKISLMGFVFLGIVAVAYASWIGDALKMGIVTDGINITIPGNLSVRGTITGTGAQTQSSNIILQNGEIISNATDGVVSITANDDAVEWLDFQLKSSNTSVSDNDRLQISWWGLNDTAAFEYGQDVLTATDVTTGTEDSIRSWVVATAGTLATELNLSGAALYPNVDAGLNLGIQTSNQFGNVFTDTLSVGTSSHTSITGIKIGDLAFAGDTSKTATVPTAGSSYAVTTDFKTNSANAYVKTAAISSTTLTVTASAATTGTCSYVIYYY